MAAVQTPAVPQDFTTPIKNGLNGVAQPSEALEGNFPASWYTQQGFYEFERRAIFSKQWLLMTHRIRLPEPGSFLRFELAGFDFFLIKDKKNEIHAFHNICRHRAYPIIEDKDGRQGKKSILSCGYHGWSYSLSVNLAKAPKFEEVEGFKKEDYSLFSIHTHVDKTGFIWVNLDASNNPISWEEMNGGTDEQPRYNDFNIDSYVYERTWITNGKYNWKLVGENYNECYHCTASHPGIRKITNLDRYAVEPKKGRMEHTPPNRDDIKPEDVKFFGNGAFTFNYPNTSVNFSTPYFFIMRVVPKTATTVTTEYEVYRNPESDIETFNKAAEFFEGIELEDYDLMNGVQANLNNNVFVNGPLHKARESGIFAFKRLVQKHLQEHREIEAAMGCQVHPARRNQQLYKTISDEEKFCGDVCACRDASQSASNGTNSVRA
ncbi:hypothetical protein FSARC_12846 [Fusarium sarcochroum]|uniref:Choline monooxygenase, chloroplastic n=1 Tax=Fusarium sarcochroum TaxID=1208366 RepID=A0A8H4WUY0_9HYPO|nr:hypothetical protein FSARC_12846 [Fusarium sarcochroum]